MRNTILSTIRLILCFITAAWFSFYGLIRRANAKDLLGLRITTDPYPPEGRRHKILVQHDLVDMILSPHGLMNIFTCGVLIFLIWLLARLETREGGPSVFDRLNEAVKWLLLITFMAAGVVGSYLMNRYVFGYKGTY